MKQKLLNIGLRLGELSMILFWLLILGTFLNQSLAESFNRLLLSLSEAQAATQEGIELDLLTDTVNTNSVTNGGSLNVWQSDSGYAVAGRLNTVDPRTNALRKYLKDQNSPLAQYAENFVREADRSNQDWRLVAAISGVESAFGTIVPYGSNNGWGWKGDPTRDYSVFADWPAAISFITERLTSGYGRNPDPYMMVQSYCPPCATTPGLPWPAAVTKFMREMDEYLAREVN